MQKRRWDSPGALAARLMLALVVGCQGPGHTEPADWDPTRYHPAVDSVGQVALDEGRIVGLSIAVVPDRGEPLVRHFGYADREAGVPVTDETRLNFASVTKPFTALGVLTLVDDGRLSLDDPVAELLPGVLPDEQGRRITVRQLLNHTNGLNDYVDADVQRWYATGEPFSRQFVLDWLATHPPDFAPGEAWSYSNSGFYLAGMVIEAVTGMSWQDHLEQAVFGPLGLTSLGPCDEMPVPRRTRGYLGTEDSVRLNTAHYIEDGVRGDGGLCGTARDLASLPRALETSALLSDSLREELTTPTELTDGTTVDYGVGFRLGNLEGIRVWGHTGGSDTYVAKLAHYEAAGITTAVLINTVRVDRDPIWIEADLTEILLDLPAGEAADSLLGDVEPTPYLGEYVTGRWDGTARVFAIVTENGTLRRRYDAEDGPRGLTLIPRGQHRFAHPRFLRDRYVFHVADGVANGYSEYYQGMFVSYQRRKPS